MKRIFIILISFTSSLLFSQNVDKTKLNQLSNTIAEEACNCVQKNKEKDDDLIGSAENCFLESFKKNELKVKQLLGANYLDEENSPNILQIVRNAESYWTSTCLDKIKSDMDFTLNLVTFFNDNGNLTYDLNSSILEDEAEKLDEDSGAVDLYEFDGVFMKSYVDKNDILHFVVKDTDNENIDLFAVAGSKNFKAFLQENQFKPNDKVKVSYSLIDVYNAVENKDIESKVLFEIKKM